MTSPEASVLIIGAGTFGASTSHHLSKTYRDPSRITLVDRWAPTAPQHDKHAAAIDTNRIIRTDYPSHLYCDLANEALHFWFWSIAVQGHFHKTGWTVLEGEGEGRFGAAVRKTFQERGGDYTREVPWEEVQGIPVLQGLRGADYPNGYFNPEAGWCDAEKATTSFTKVALELGVRRVVGEVVELVLEPERKGGLKGVRLQDGRVLEADRIVLAAGAWTSALLSPVEDALKIQEQDRIERQITAVGRLSAYYTLSPQETQDMIEAKMPVLVLSGLADIIPPSHPNRTLKINDLATEIVNTTTTPSGHRITTPSLHPHQASIPPRLLHQSTTQVLHQALPAWSKHHHPSRWRICYDAITPTEDWLLCRHPHAQLSNLFLAVGGSFHSYKFLPVAGKYMLNVLEGRSNGADKDEAWRWKSAEERRRTSGKEFGQGARTGHRRELGSYEERGGTSRL